MLGGSSVSTYFKGQAVVALSSGEAEYYGLVSATPQMLWLAEHSPGLGMEIQCPHVDGRHSWNRDWEPPRARTSKTHRPSVLLDTSDGH